MVAHVDRRAAALAAPAAAAVLGPEIHLRTYRLAMTTDSFVVKPYLFPGGDKAGWGLKAVQLDQEAKGVIGRADKPPVRLRRL